MSERKTIILTRFLFTEIGTWGTLELRGKFHCFTVERPWLENAPYVSCIPTGVYVAKHGMFSKGSPPYPDLELQDVPGRTNIEVHAANFPEDLSGCIAPVESLVAEPGGVIRGTNSKHTLSALLAALGPDDAYLVIRNQRQMA